MSDLNPLTVGPDEVKVRMYRQGLGDCFLLAFPGETKPSYVLIDCGLVTSAPNRERIKDVVADIAKATNRHIDLLIVTHEHWDHVSGFLEAADGFKDIEIENLWLAWTEDETKDLAQKILEEREQRFADVRAALGRARQEPGMAHIRGLLDFFGDDGFGMGAAAGRGTVEALKRARALSKTPARYCYPKEELTVPGASGVRVYVLGPPLSKEKLEQVNPTVAGHETYTEADATALDARRSFLMAARYGGTSTALSANTDDQDLFDLSFPFDKRYRISEGEAKSDFFFRQHYGFEAAEVPGEKPGPEWRRIDDDWLDAAEDLALRLDRLTNNTSLVLAFELVKSRKVLLFPADAQVGNWMSWHDYTWTVQDGDRFRDVNAQDLLARTVLYKVGHHGSHNATLRDKGLKLMSHPDLVAMVPVDVKTAHEKKRWKKMPFQPLIADLKKRTRGRLLQVDQPLTEKPPEGVSEEVWKEFLERTKEQPLYFQHTVVDEPATSP
jgi:hypothetical protein